MVGSGLDRSKEAVGMMALHESLRGVCLNSDWTYSVFWTIRPRLRVRGGSGCKVGDDNGNLMLMWEDGFCKGRTTALADCLGNEIDGEDPVRKAFSKMSIQLYNYGEGLMGKVASDKCHKWVFKEPTECEPNTSNYWQSSYDALPPEWNDQFDSGIQTIAVIQAGHGLLQLGSCKIIPEDLHFVLRMRHTFETLGYQSGYYLSQLFPANQTTTNTPPLIGPRQQTLIQTHPLPPLFNRGPCPTNSLISSQNPGGLGFPQIKDENHMFVLPGPTGSNAEDAMENHEDDLKWPNGLSFFSALTGRHNDAKLLFNPDGLGNKPGPNTNPNSDHNHDDFLSLDGETEDGRETESKYKRSFTLPARIASPSSSTLLDHHSHNNPIENKNSEGGMQYPDHMTETL